MIAGWEKGCTEEREMESPGTVEPRALSYSYHQSVQRKQGPREVQGLTQGHTAVRGRTGIQALIS